MPEPKVDQTVKVPEVKPTGDKAPPVGDGGPGPSKLQGAVEMINGPANPSELPTGEVNKQAKAANAPGADIRVEPNPKNPINRPAGVDQPQANVALATTVADKSEAAKLRANQTAANAGGDRPPGQPPPGADRTPPGTPPPTTDRQQAALDRVEATRQAGADRGTPAGQPPPGIELPPGTPLPTTDRQQAALDRVEATRQAGADRGTPGQPAPVGDRPPGTPPPTTDRQQAALDRVEGTRQTAADRGAPTGQPPPGDRAPGTPAPTTDRQAAALDRVETLRQTAADRGAPVGQPPPGGDRTPGSPAPTTDRQTAALDRVDALRQTAADRGVNAPPTPGADTGIRLPGAPAAPTDRQTAALDRVEALRQTAADRGVKGPAAPGADTGVRAPGAPAPPTDRQAAALDRVEALRQTAADRGVKTPQTPAGDGRAPGTPAPPTDRQTAALNRVEALRQTAADRGVKTPGTPGGDAPSAPTDPASRRAAARQNYENLTAQANDRAARPPRPDKPVPATTLDTTGKPRPAAEVPRQTEAQRRFAETQANANLTPAERRAQVVEDRAAARAARRDAGSNPPIKPADAPATPQQTRAQAIADNAAARRADRQAKIDARTAGDPPQDPTRGRRVDPPVPRPDATGRGRPRPDGAPVTPGDPPVRPARPERPQPPTDLVARKPGQPDTAGDTTGRPGRTDRPGRGPDVAGDTTGRPGRPERPGRGPDTVGDTTGRPGRPPVPGDGLPPIARRGERGESADPLARGERGRRGDNGNAPLDPRQQKFITELTKGSDPRAQQLRENFERLSPQNRNNIMNLEGKDQLDMLAKLSKIQDGKRGLSPDGKLPIEGGKLVGDTGNPTTGGNLAKTLGRQDLKIPGLDLADPNNRKFMTDATNRLSELKLDGNTANMKVSDVLKGLDPQKVSALEKFLTNNSNVDVSKLTMGQLDATRLTQLMTGRSEMVAGRALTPQEALQNLTRQLTGDGGGLNNIGRALNDMGQPGRLSDLVVRNLDARSPGAGSGFDIGLALPGRMQGDFTARLNPLQELTIRNMMDNAGLGRLDFSARGDMIQTVGLSQVLATTFGDSRGDFTVRGDIRSSMSPADAANMVVDGYDSSPSSGAKSQEYISKLPIDATTGLPYDPATGKLLDPNTGRPIGDKVAAPEKKTQSDSDDGDEKDEKEKKKNKKDSEDVDAEKAKQKAMLLILKAKQKREQELREKQLKDEKQKKEDETRIRYICKDGDTIQSVALKQLRDNRVAPLIYQINKEVIPTKIVNGETVPLLHAGLVIWLPSPKECKEFRQKLLGSNSPAAPTEEKFASAEDELAARFGAGWDANKTGAESGGQPAAPEMNDIERKLMEDAVAEAKRRRENIEKALGPITGSTVRGARADGEHLTYQVRLGDTLRSVATKHPSIGDVNLWRLLAEVNDLSTDVDSKGQPKAGLARGGKIKIPTAQEIAEYRQRIGSMVGQPITKEQRVAKNCPKCGRMTVQSATLCPCGHEFDAKKETSSGRDAGAIVLEAINNKDESRRSGPRTEDLDADDRTPTTRVGQPTNDASRPPESRAPQERTKETAAYAEPSLVWATCKDFDPTCRLTKSALSWEAADGKLIIQLQLRNEENGEWFPILDYEVYGSHSIRHTFVRQTRAKKTVKIDLPATAAMELAQNDLLANWNNYKVKYLLA